MRGVRMQELQIKEIFRDQLPPLKEETYRKLEKDICEKGCFDPIRTWRGYIIDGHHRHKICTENNVEFRTLCLDDIFENETQVRIWIIDHQDGRRELTPYVSAELQMEKADLEESKQGKRTDLIQQMQETNANESLRTSLTRVREVENEKNPYERLAEKAGMSGGNFSKACYIAQNAPEGTKEKLRKGEASIRPEYKKLKQKEKSSAIKANLESIAVQEVKATEGVYDVIAIDPPWDIGEPFGIDSSAGYNPLQYPTMSIDEIKALEIPCADDCHVFLWTTQKFLSQSFGVLESWGLQYGCTFTWVKNGGPQPLGYPQYTTEFFIYAKKGSPKFIETTDFRTHLNAKRTGHSSKPEEFYDLLRRVTAGRKLDMFNRREIEGFNVWGNQAAV